MRLEQLSGFSFIWRQTYRKESPINTCSKLNQIGNWFGRMLEFWSGLISYLCPELTDMGFGGRPPPTPGVDDIRANAMMRIHFTWCAAYDHRFTNSIGLPSPAIQTVSDRSPSSGATDRLESKSSEYYSHVLHIGKGPPPPPHRTCS